MENQNNIKRIKRACIKANPKIMELNFGCEIVFEDITYIVCNVISRKEIEIFNVETHKVRVFDPDFLKKKSDDIIGRPIRLADVLLALVAIPRDSSIKDSPEWYAVTHWVLEDDDLLLQSSETVAFIAELLK